jgi:hypothetical protein
MSATQGFVLVAVGGNPDAGAAAPRSRTQTKAISTNPRGNVVRSGHDQLRLSSHWRNSSAKPQHGIQFVSKTAITMMSSKFIGLPRRAGYGDRRAGRRG